MGYLCLKSQRLKEGLHSMQALPIHVHRLRPEAVVPTYATSGSAGLDLSAAITSAVTLAPGSTAKVPTGWALAIPAGYEGQVRPRSGLATKHGVTVVNAPGTIDSDYRGEVLVALINLGLQAFTIEPGMRIAQLIIAPVCRVTLSEVADIDALGQTSRAQGGFGSTGLTHSQ